MACNLYTFISSFLNPSSHIIHGESKRDFQPWFESQQHGFLHKSKRHDMSSRIVMVAQHQFKTKVNLTCSEEFLFFLTYLSDRLNTVQSHLSHRTAGELHEIYVEQRKI